MGGQRHQSRTGEVRRCAACGQPALVVREDWQHRFAGIDLPARTVELRCQACGIEVVLHPPSKIRAERLLAWLLLPAVVPGLVFFARARRMERAWTDNPVVEGVVQLAAPGRAGPPDRRCACSAPARCVAQVRKGTWALGIGRRYDYLCDRCGSSFGVHSTGGIVFAIALATGLAAAGAFVIAHPPGTAVGAAESNRWFGVGVAALGAVAWLVALARVRGRVKHPLSTRPRRRRW